MSLAGKFIVINVSCSGYHTVGTRKWPHASCLTSCRLLYCCNMLRCRPTAAHSMWHTQVYTGAAPGQEMNGLVVSNSL